MAKSGSNGLLAWSEQGYRWLLLLYPVAYRRRYGPLMAQLFRDLVRDANRRAGTIGVLQLWIRTLWDVMLTAPAEHLRSDPIGWSNCLVTPLPWWQVLLGILPGLLVVGYRSRWMRTTLGYQPSELIYHYGLPAVCLVLVLVGWSTKRKLAAWSFPALGLLHYYLPTAVAQFLSTSLRTSGWLYGGWLVVTTVFGIAFVAGQKRHLRMPPYGWLLVGLLLLTEVWPMVLFDAVCLLAPLAVGLHLARRDKLFPVLVIAAAQYWLVDELYDPNYGMLMWSSNYTAERIVSLLPALSFLVLAPVCVWCARSTLQRVGGLLLPPLVGLISGETIRAIVDDRPHYFLHTWPIRIGGALGFVVVLALAMLVYLSFEGSNVTPDRTSAKQVLSMPPDGAGRGRACGE